MRVALQLLLLLLLILIAPLAWAPRWRAGVRRWAVVAGAGHAQLLRGSWRGSNRTRTHRAAARAPERSSAVACAQLCRRRHEEDSSRIRHASVALQLNGWPPCAPPSVPRPRRSDRCAVQPRQEERGAALAALGARCRVEQRSYREQPVEEVGAVVLSGGRGVEGQEQPTHSPGGNQKLVPMRKIICELSHQLAYHLPGHVAARP